MLHPVGFWASAGAAGPTVSPNTANVSYSTDVADCYANLQYNSSGEEFKNNDALNNNYSTSRGMWLDSGSSSDVWLERTINSGSLSTDPGAGRLNLGTTRSFQCIDSNPTAGSTKTANLTIDFWDAASGGTKIGTVTLTLSAAYTDICPTCCFTPDTLILMADGSQKAIIDIEVGDMVRVQNGVAKVGEVIVRYRRPMHDILFSNGTLITTSEDHPFYVLGKGWCSVMPTVPYKDVGVPKVLCPGDLCVDRNGDKVRVVSITIAEYPHAVYTLDVTKFFANGILVY